MIHDHVLLIVSLSKNYVELHFIKIEHHKFLRFFFVRGLKKNFLVSRLGVEGQLKGRSVHLCTERSPTKSDEIRNQMMYRYN